jgi:cephalosporin hydroxylase
MNEKEFQIRNHRFIKKMGSDKKFKKITNSWIVESVKHEYSYHFRWFGIPIIQYPQDMIAYQEIIWQTKPDLIIETGIARGGSLIFSASLLEIIGRGQVLGIDIDIHKENRIAVEKHPLSKRIHMLEGSSISNEIVNSVRRIASKKKRILVVLDSNHTHEHVLNELRLYSPLVSRGSYIVVFDSIIGDLPNYLHKNRPWNKKNNPKTAIFQFLKENNRFIIDDGVVNKLAITVSPYGYLKCIG